MSAWDAHSRLLQQVTRARKLLERLGLSDGDFNAWSTTAEDLLTRIYGKESVALRGFKNAVCRPTLQEMASSALDRPHRETVKNRLTLLESLVESLLHDMENESKEPVSEAKEDVVLEEPNRLILSWSGRTSHKIASFLYEWWGKVIPEIVPWISSEDIAKGRRWFPELMSQLGKSTTCLICVTPENHKAPWVYYEAGVIAAKQDNGIICTVLFGVTTIAIEHTPLAQFQATLGDNDDMWRLTRDLNRGLSEGQRSNEALREAYEKHWPELETAIADALQNSVRTTESAETIDLVSEYRLSDDAKELLRAAAGSSDGLILVNNHDGGRDFQIDGKNFVNDASPRAQARWQSAFDELFNQGLIGNFRRATEVFQVTHAGFTVYDSL